MSSLLTFALAFERLPYNALPAIDNKLINNATERKAEAYNRFNRVIERFFDEGKWPGTMQEAVINVYGSKDTGYYFTLPRHLQTCIFSEACCRNIPVQAQWFSYLPGGGKPASHHYGAVRDNGIGYCVFRDIDTPAQITVESDQTESAATYLWIRAKDADGEKIYTSVGGNIVEGIRIDLSASPVTTSQTISEIYGADKAITKGNITIRIGTTIHAVYEPGERAISYRRYWAGGAREQVRGWFKRCAVWNTSDNDPVYPASLEALKLGLFALNYEENGDQDRANTYWAMALNILNKATTEHHQSESSPMQIGYGMMASAIRHMN